LLAVLIEYEGGLKCAICGRRIAPTKTGGNQLTIDHIIPFGEGGGHCLVNLQLTHRKCNEKKADTYTQADIDKVARRIEAIVAAKRAAVLVADGVLGGGSRQSQPSSGAAELAAVEPAVPEQDP
jgi:5-methylcytosine-specific restriction endonuclease McrA